MFSIKSYNDFEVFKIFNSDLGLQKLIDGLKKLKIHNQQYYNVICEQLRQKQFVDSIPSEQIVYYNKYILEKDNWIYWGDMFISDIKYSLDTFQISIYYDYIENQIVRQYRLVSISEYIFIHWPGNEFIYQFGKKQYFFEFIKKQIENACTSYTGDKNSEQFKYIKHINYLIVHHKHEDFASLYCIEILDCINVSEILDPKTWHLGSDKIKGIFLEKIQQALSQSKKKGTPNFIKSVRLQTLKVIQELMSKEEVIFYKNFNEIRTILTDDDDKDNISVEIIELIFKISKNQSKNIIFQNTVVKLFEYYLKHAQQSKESSVVKYLNQQILKNNQYNDLIYFNSKDHIDMVELQQKVIFFDNIQLYKILQYCYKVSQQDEDFLYKTLDLVYVIYQMIKINDKVGSIMNQILNLSVDKILNKPINIIFELRTKQGYFFNLDHIIQCLEQFQKTREETKEKTETKETEETIKKLNNQIIDICLINYNQNISQEQKKQIGNFYNINKIDYIDFKHFKNQFDNIDYELKCRILKQIKQWKLQNPNMDLYDLLIKDSIKNIYETL